MTDVPIPPPAFYTLLSVARRWSVPPLDIAGWAAEGQLGLSAAVPPVIVDSGQTISGLVDIEAASVLPLFRDGFARQQSAAVQWIAVDGHFARIQEPLGGVSLRAADILIRRPHVEAFERRHRIAHRMPARRGGTGAPCRYDWDSFYGALARHVHDYGIPRTQAEMARQMMNLLDGRGADGPSERTIRRRVAAIWRELRAPAAEAAP